MAVSVESAPNPWFSWTYLERNIDDLLRAGREHLFITIAAMLLAIAVAIPLTLLVRRYPRLQVPVLAGSGILYTIPSLALIAGLWPWLGLTPWTVIVALAMYALLVVLRNMVVGLDAVSASVVDAARGVGYGRRQLLWRVQVPLATPTILAGIRIATVSTVGLVTIGALVGHGGFGTVILGGFVNNFYHAQILAGTIAVVVMALLLEGLLILLERLLTPWTRVKGSW
ncbi:MAG: osmoprotectant transport system permease protein [Actinomycetota bacterium]|nr:osmoprotectant transport system permease protein [Actinomycetota bacterium]